MAMQAYAVLGETQPIMADPSWPGKIHNGLVNPGVKVKLRSQFINKLMVACSGIALVWTFRQPI